jgi:hypothetical protein
VGPDAAAIFAQGSAVDASMTSFLSIKLWILVTRSSTPSCSSTLAMIIMLGENLLCFRKEQETHERERVISFPNRRHKMKKRDAYKQSNSNF